MGIIDQAIRRLYARTGITLIVLAALLLASTSLVQLFFARKGMREEAAMRAKSELEVTELEIEKVTSKVEVAAKNVIWTISNYLSEPDSMYMVLRQILDSNSDIADAAVAFREDYYPSLGHWYEPLIARRPDGSYEAMQAGSESHDYFHASWYTSVVESGKGGWSEPYYDDKGGRAMVVTYSEPILDANNQFVGILGLDISLDWLTDLIGNIQLYPDSYSTLTSKSGQMLVCPAETLDTRNLARFVAPIESTGWQMSIVIPYAEIYRNVRRVGRIVVLLQILGLLLLAAIVQYTARKQMKLEEVEENKERIESELKIARGIQMAMLPKIFPPFPERSDIDMFGTLMPAKEVGGDLYDFFIRDERLFFCIGDVSGKGIPASLVMAVTRSLFRTVSAHEYSPEHIITVINDSMSEVNESNMFVTFFLGVLDMASGELTYCNAGHNAPMLLGPDGVRMLDVVPNLPLGVVEGMDFQPQKTKISSGDGIFLYTDGLTEAENIRKELYGEEKVRKDLSEMVETPAADIVARLVEAVRNHAGEEPQSDDLTMLFIRYFGNAGVIRQQLALRNDIQEISKLQPFIEDIAEKAGLDAQTGMQLNLAVEEAVTNVISYAYPEGTEGHVDLEAVLSPGQLEFILTDSGRPFDPTAAAEADTSLSLDDRPIGGLGIYLVRNLMDTVQYRYASEKNILKMIKKL